MTSPEYLRALNRSDLSQWVLHLVHAQSVLPSGHLGTAGDILNSIFTEGYVRPSQQEHVLRYCPGGAACFYDAPPAVWPEIALSNPNNRPPLGIICHKVPIWKLGGRPAIYTDLADPNIWPERERFRVIVTDLGRSPQPIDWMHEREWRIPGELSLYQPQFPYTWWWPIVPNDEWMQYLWSTYPSIHSIYVLERNAVINRHAA